MKSHVTCRAMFGLTLGVSTHLRGTLRRRTWSSAWSRHTDRPSSTALRATGWFNTQHTNMSTVLVSVCVMKTSVNSGHVVISKEHGRFLPPLNNNLPLPSQLFSHQHGSHPAADRLPAFYPAARTNGRRPRWRERRAVQHE